MSDLFDTEIGAEHPKKEREFGHLNKFMQVRIFDMKESGQLSSETYDKILKNFDVFQQHVHTQK